MIRVEGPDGYVAEFPDDTPRETIKAAMQKRFGAPTVPPNQGTAAARGVVGGLPIVGPTVLKGLENVGAYGESLISGQSQEAELARIRERGAVSDAEYPKTSTAGHIAGGVLGTAPAVLAAPTLFGAGAAPMAGRMLASAGSGGAINAADTAARGGDDTAIRNSAMIGLGAGAAAPAAAGVAGGVLKSAAGLGSSLPGAAGDAFARIAGDSRVARALLRSGMSREEVNAAMTRAAELGKGEEFLLADAMGTEGQAALGAASRGGGQARERIVQTLNDRQAAQPERLVGDVEDAFGTSGTARGESRALLERARREAGPVYREAEQVPLPPAEDMSTRLNLLTQHPDVQRGMKTGAEMAERERVARGELGPEPAPPRLADGMERERAAAPVEKPPERGVPVTAPAADAAPQQYTMRQLQQAKIGLDTMVEAERDPIKGLSPTGRSIDQLRRALVEEIAAVNPRYADANAIYRGPMEIRDAIDLGLKAARGGRAADNVAAFRDITVPAEQQGFRQGYADRLAGRLEGPGPDDRTRMFASPKSRQEVEAFAAPGEHPRFNERLGLEQTMSETRRRAIGGSPTAERLADDASFNGAGVVAALMAGHPGAAALAAGRSGLNLATGNLPRVRDRVADVLMNRDPKVLEEILADALNRRRIGNALMQSAEGGGRAYFGNK